MTAVVVTGATGLIGSRIVKNLQSHDFNVVATARLPTPEIGRELGVPVYDLDVLRPEESDLPDVADGILIHCATANDIVSKDAARGYELSVNGTWNVLQLASSLGIKRAIYFSTFQVYGTELVGVVDESFPTRCETPYGQNHWFGEEVCRLIATKQKMAIAVVRPSNVYGAPVASSVHRETLVPACFVRTAIINKEIVLHSSGRQLRNFVSTEEVADACIHLLHNFSPGFEIYNICSGYAATMLELAQLTAEVYQEKFGVCLPVNILSDLPSDTNQFVARSRLESLWKSKNQSRNFMRQEIGALFDQMVRVLQSSN